jgi:hypothetical protein
MFFIVNKTKGTVVLSDLGITLGPRQAVDLDKTVERHKSDASKTLKLSVKSGQIEIRSKDGEKPPHQDRKPSPQAQSNSELQSLKDDLKEMKDLLAQQSSSSGLNKDDLHDFAQKIIKSIPKQETVVQGNSIRQEIRTDEEVEMDESLLVDINARTVDNIVGSTDIKVMKYKEEIQKNTILDNIDELEGLL